MKNWPFMWCTRGRSTFAALAAGAFLLVAASAGAAPADVDLRISLTATTTHDLFARGLPSGETVPVTSRNFVVYLFVDPRPARAKLRIELGEGLRWRTDGSDPGDPGEGCTSSTLATAECDASVLTGGDVGWWWDVVAPQDGSFTYRAAIVETAEPDPDLTDNTSSITIVVKEETGGGSAVSASAVRLTPAKPRAGFAVAATVRVTVDGAALLPARVACTGAIGTAKTRGVPSAAAGRATCTYRPPRSAKGKALRGSVSFTARGERFTNRFSTKLG